MNNIPKICLAWSVHFFTAFGAFLGLLAVSAINAHQYTVALCYMGIAFLIDNIDGMLARLFKVNLFAYTIDGDLLDNIIGFFNYAMIPAAFILLSSLIDQPYRLLSAALICFASCYQFTQYNAYTEEYFFKGFPSYWNILVFYAYCLDLPQTITLLMIIILFIGSFMPIKCIYPSNLKYVSNNKHTQFLILLATILWNIAAGLMLFSYPKHNIFVTSYLIIYPLFYILLSLYLTCYPLQKPGGYD